MDNMETKKTKDVEVMLGDPKKAMLAMSVPVIIAMVVQNINNVIDSVWVAGLGTSALTAVGLVFPLFFILTSIGNGIGIGSTSAIAKYIGRGEKDKADKAATQAIYMTIVGSILIGTFILLIQRTFFEIQGAGDTLGDCIAYTTPIFLCAPIFLLNGVISNLLRSEGASRKSMYSQILAAVINIILDPFFIYDYGLGLGIAGAAWATCLSVTISLILLIYWYFFSGNTYLKIRFKGVGFDKELCKDIMRVGFPASLEMIVISFVSIISNAIILMAAGTDGVAIYSSTWRIVNIAMIPMMGIGSAIVPVCAAAYGLRRYNNIKTSYIFSFAFITVITLAVTTSLYIFAEQAVTIFTYSDATSYLKEGMIFGLRICCIWLNFIPIGFVTVGLFQSLGMGVKSLICTLVRNFLAIPVCYIFVITMGGMTSFWYGISISEILGTAIAAVWGVLVLRSLLRQRAGDKPSEITPPSV